jgi:hypothetical protein
MVDEVKGFGVYSGLEVTATLDPATQPFLFDHQIDGVPVLPGVMGVEAFAAAASIAFPDLHVAAIEDIDFLAPFKFYRNEARTLTVRVHFVREDAAVVAHCRLIGSRALANQPEPQVTTHFTGKVRLAAQIPSIPQQKSPPPDGSELGSEPIYDIYFHGPAYQVIDRVGKGDGVVVGAMAGELRPNHLPEDRSLATTPRLTELAFQTAGVWEIGVNGTMALPLHIDRVVYAGKQQSIQGQLRAIVRPRNDGAFDAFVVDESGVGLVEMSGYRTVQLPTPLDGRSAAQLREAMTKED